MEPRKGLSTVNAVVPATQVLELHHGFDRRVGALPRGVEIGAEQTRLHYFVSLQRAPRKPGVGVQRQLFQRVNVGFHAEAPVHHVEHALADLLAKYRRRGQIQDLGCHVVDVEIACDQMLPQPLLHQDTGNAR